MSASDVDFLPCHPSRLLRCQEDNHVCDVLWSTDSSERNRDQDLVLQLRSDPARLYWPQRHCVNCYAHTAQLYRRASRVALERVLAGAIGNLGWKAVCPGSAYVDDAAPRSMSLDVPSRKLCHEQNRRSRIYSEQRIKAADTDRLGAPVGKQFVQLVR